MRRMIGMGVGLLGLALTAPTPSWADDFESTAAERSEVQQPPAAARRDIHHTPTIDPSSLKMWKKLQGQVPPPPGMAMPADTCTACQVNGAVPAVASGGAPGYAVSGPEAGLPDTFGEPAPIGVMQAGYRTASASAPAGYASTVPGGAAAPGMMAASPMPFAGPLAQPHHRRSSILAHVVGLSGVGRQRAEERMRQAREAHAAVSYGPAGQSATELPSAMVYGR